MKWFSLVLVFLCATATHAQTTRFLQKVDFNDIASATLSGVGDVNADGVPDYAVGVQRNVGSETGTSGAVQVFSGADGAQLLYLQSEETLDSFGSSLAAAGDVDLDGYDDILVGAPSSNITHQMAGAAMVMSGFDGSVLHVVYGTRAFALAGSTVTGMGDLNGDGHADFAVGEPTEADSASTGAGIVRVFSGRDASVLMGIAGQDMNRTGASLANANDINNDGVNDIVVGQPNHVFKSTSRNDRGRVQVFSGANRTILLSLDGDTDFGKSGYSVASVGDITGDGVSDLAIAEPFRVDSRLGTMGRIKMISGANGSLIRSLHSSSSTNSLGLQMAATGDMDSDGFPDLAALQQLDNDFEIRVFSGSTGAVINVFPSHRFGSDGSMGVANIGDVNSDGVADLGTLSLRRGNAPLFTPDMQVRVYETGQNPVSTYISKSKMNPPLSLSWSPSHGNVYDTTGRITCSGMSPNANGVLLVSFAATDMTAYSNDLLVDVGAQHLFAVYDVQAPKTGPLTLPEISRRSPAMAGNSTFVQLWEVSPTIRSSNGIEFVLMP